MGDDSTLSSDMVDKLETEKPEKKSDISTLHLDPPQMINIGENLTLKCENVLPNSKPFVTKKWPQYFAAFAAQVCGFAIGASWFWTATALPDMANSGDLGELTKSDRSWITSTPMLGALLVCPITGYCIDKIGRQRSLLWGSVPAATSWFFIAYSKNLLLILLCRIVVGACGGLSGQVAPLLIAESVEPPFRGMLMCMFEVMFCVGTLYIYVIGSFTSWNLQAIACAIVPIVGFVSLYFIPESPYFLMEKGNVEGAKNSLCWLRGASSSDLIADEIDDVRQTIESKSKNQESLGWSEALKDKSIWKPILLSMALMVFFQGTYINVILAATVEIFESAGSYDEYLSTILIGVIQVIATLVPMLASDKLGRRVLLLTSLVMVTISLICLGLFFHLRRVLGEPSSVIQGLGSLPLTSLVGYVIACSIGIVPLSCVITAEIAPPKAKGLASGLVGVWNRVIGFFVIFTFWDVIDVLGEDGTYWLIAGVNMGAAIFTFFFIPETKGKTLEEIQSSFATSKKPTNL